MAGTSETSPVHLVSLMQPNKPDRPNRPNEQEGLADFFSILPRLTRSIAQKSLLARLSVLPHQ